MCGICGIKSSAIEERDRLIPLMLESLSHRGPDDTGAYSDEDISLGIKRLSIIDLATGSQPVFNEDKSIGIICNGEIYNFLKLRQDLTGKGHIFYTNSDVEPLVHLYEEYGTDCLQYIKGMFSFALWNRRNKSLFIARDRFGIKPLYYYHRNGVFAFASELKALLKLPFIPRELDRLALNLYFSLEYVPAPHSIFKNISKLKPAHFIVYKNNVLEMQNYWSLKRAPLNNDLLFPAARQMLEERLRVSVKEHLASDVPLGIFLSGGIDSSTLVAFSRKSGNQDCVTFSVGFEEESFDESEYSGIAAKHFGVTHNNYVFTKNDFLNMFREITGFLDEPLADMSIFPAYALSKFSHAQVKVALSGEGADELFMGYPTYLAHRYAGLLNMLPKSARRCLKSLIDALPVSFRYFSMDFKLKQFMRGSGERDPVLRNLIWMAAYLDDEKSLLFNKDARPAVTIKDAMHDYAMGFIDNQRASFYKKLQYADFATYLAEDLLVKADRAGMASSLEIRVPFLDHELVEFVWGLNDTFIYQKKILKNLMQSHLPHKIISRTKKGFAMPFSNWVTDKRFLTMTEDFFNPGYLKKQGLFEYNYVHRLLQEHLLAKRDNRKKLGAYIMFQSWYQHWMN